MSAFVFMGNMGNGFYMVFIKKKKFMGKDSEGSWRWSRLPMECLQGGHPESCALVCLCNRVAGLQPGG